MAVRFRTLGGDPVDIGDHDAEHEKHKDGQKKINRMIERHGCAPWIHSRNAKMEDARRALIQVKKRQSPLVPAKAGTQGRELLRS